MAFNVAGLSAYVENKGKQIAIQAVNGAKTAKLLIDNNAFQNEVKGSHKILKMDIDVNFQDGGSCGRTALGSVTLSDKTITVKSITDFQNLCAKTLYNTYYSQMLRKGQNPADETFDPAFIDSIIELKSSKVAEAIEVLLWQGDTASGSANLNKIDGLLKQITSAADEITIAEAGATVVEKLQSVHAAMPVKVRNQSDFRIFLGQDLYDSYVVALANSNKFHQPDQYKLFGTSAILEPTPGLDGTNKVVAARISDLQFATDMESDMTNVEFTLSTETKNWYMDYHFAVGIAAVHTNQIGIADFAV